jgi:hypothetical protein
MAPKPVNPAEQRVPPSDPYWNALADCIYRVRASGQQPTCHFFRPLDQMAFGQKHCDEKCAALTGAYQTSPR